MDQIDRLQLLAELANEHCRLNHGPGTKGEDYPACDYLVVPIGYKEDEVREVTVRELAIPVCYDCAEALQGDEWTLLYCLECTSNQWVYRKLAKLKYRHHVLWLRGCPHCTNELRGLYFADLPKVRRNAMLLVKEKEIETVD